MLAVRINQPNEKGKNTFHPKLISWSYRKRGRQALITMKRTIKKPIFNPNQTEPGTRVNGNTSIIGNQPPKKRIAVSALINNILVYSPKKNRANPIAEYSTL